MFGISFRSINYLIIICTICCCQHQISKLEELNSKESLIKSEPVFESYLALEYLNFARKLRNVKDFKNSEYFAKKGLDAFIRKDIIPENPINFATDNTQIKEMVFMQKRLEEINSINSLRINLPIQLAHLHYLYDCWIIKESSNIFVSEDLAYCKTTFSKLLEEIENYYHDTKKDKTVKTQIIETKFDRFEINFDIQSSNINDKEAEELSKIINYLKKFKGEYSIILLGSADDNKDNLLNQNLIRDRINTVKNYLLANGVIDYQISVNYDGEDLPDIVTSDSLNYKINRNVSIYIINQGKENASSYPLPLLQNLYLKEQIRLGKERRGLKN
ncbi:hypothetical protein LBMAG18_05370 [Alphaproteobacteria bacterium]|nr:hypothetical protein LBMAG18_05370 [Alphaproteobacteria bacterium]